jgi:hypothetical protein
MEYVNLNVINATKYTPVGVKQEEISSRVTYVIRHNTDNSKYAKHFLETQPGSRKTEATVDILKITG